MQVFRAAFRRPFPQALPQLFGTGRTGKESLEERPQIKPGASNHDGQTLTRPNFIEGSARQPGIIARSEELDRRDHVDQVMPHPLPFFMRRLGGPNLQFPIDCH